MVGQTRNKLREAASAPMHSPRSVQSRRRRRATGAGEPELGEERQAELETPELLLPLGGGNLPGGARRCSPRRTRHPRVQNCAQMEVVSRALFLGRFQFLNCFLELLRNKAHLLRRRPFLGRTIYGIGEQTGRGEPSAGAPSTAQGRMPSFQGPGGAGWVPREPPAL